MSTTLDRYTAEQEPLYNVLTIKECAEIFSVHPKTVELAISTMRLVARKADSKPGEKRGIWLILYSSADALWGEGTPHWTEVQKFHE